MIESGWWTMDYGMAWHGVGSDKLRFREVRRHGNWVMLAWSHLIMYMIDFTGRLK